MAQLKDSIVQGSLRVTDTTYTTDLIVSGSQTARYALIAPTSAGAPTWRALTKADISDFPTNLNQFTNGPGYVTSSGVTSITIAATSPIAVDNSAAVTSTGTRTISLANNYGDTKNPYASKTKNYVLASPATADGAPSFRALVAADIPTLSITDKTSGTLTVGRGGTGATSFTANSVIMSGSTNTSALTTRAITNKTNDAAITNDTNIPTMNTIYYGLVVVNGANQTHATGIYAPTSAGTSGQFLKSSGSGAPSWSTIAATDVPSLNASKITAGTFDAARIPTLSITTKTSGTLPIDRGGTNATTAAAARTNLVVPMGNARIFYGTCSVSGAAKTVVCSDYDTLTDGDIIFVNFSTTNVGTTSDLTLNVNGTGARAIVYIHDNDYAQALPFKDCIRQGTYMFTYFAGSSENTSYWVMNFQSDGGARIIQCYTPISLPSGTSNTTKTVYLDGITSQHILVSWGFDNCAENCPPADLTWQTFYGYFQITNNSGTTISTTIKPTFIKPFLQTEGSGLVSN